MVCFSLVSIILIGGKQLEMKVQSKVNFKKKQKHKDFFKNKALSNDLKMERNLLKVIVILILNENIE